MASALASSQAQKPTDFKDYEDPGRCWIDLVVACNGGNPAAVREVLQQAKASKWTHDLWNEALQQDNVSTDEEDGSGDGDCGHAQCRDSGGCLLEQEDSEFWEE